MKILGYALAELRKAILAGLVPSLVLLKPDLADGALSRAEVGGLIAAFVTGAVLVFAVPNKGRGEDASSATDLGPRGLY